MIIGIAQTQIQSSYHSIECIHDITIQALRGRPFTNTFDTGERSLLRMTVSKL